MDERRPPGSFLDGLSRGNKLFQAQWRTWVGVVLIGVGIVVAGVLAVGLLYVPWVDADLGESSPGLVAADAFVAVVLQLVVAALLAVALAHVRTGRPQLRAAGQALQTGAVWGVSVVLAVVSTLLDLLTFGLGSFVTLLLTYVVLRAVDGASFVESFVDGLQMLRTRFWSRLGFLLVCSIIVSLGVLACLVGALAAVPIVALALALSYVGDHDADSATEPFAPAG